MNKPIVYYFSVINRRREGFTLIEVTVALAILSGLMSLGLSFSSQALQSVQANKRIASLQREHAAVRDAVLAISVTDALHTNCAGHPYTKYRPPPPRAIPPAPQPARGPICVPDAIPAPITAGQKTALDAVRTAVYQWPEAGILNQGAVNPLLDQPYFDNTVRPALAAAGCLNCHNGSPTGVNLGSYAALTQPNGTTALAASPLVSRNIVSSSLGKRLMSTGFTTSGVLFESLAAAAGGALRVTHFIRFSPIMVVAREMKRNRTIFRGDFSNTAGNRARWPFACPQKCPAPQLLTSCKATYIQDNGRCRSSNKCSKTIFHVTVDYSCVEYVEFGEDGVNVRINSFQADPTGQRRYISSEGTLQ